MPRLDRSFLQIQIGSLSNKKERLRWLVGLNVRAEKITNFGCNIGTETLALMWMLGASEAIGIDKDESCIHQAKDTLVYLKDSVMQIWFMLQHYPENIPEDDKEWWVTVPDFFKKGLLQEGFDVDFCVRDITKATELPSDYYDIAFCDFVLHHIWYDSKGKAAQEDTQFAVSEMARVVRPGGVVAAFELLQFSDKPKLDFSSLFEQVGLKPVHTKEIEVENSQEPGVVAEYLYKKP